MTEIEKTAHSVKTYRLRYMVAARLLAELSVFCIMLALPLVLLVLGKLFALPIAHQVIVYALGVCGLVMVPVYGFITFKVTVAGDELTTHSLFQKHICSLSKIKGLTRRSNWNWIRYVVEYEGGELTFPIWLADSDELVAMLRDAVPVGPAGKKSLVGRSFKQDPVSIIFQIGQATAGLIFIGVVCFFAISLYKSGTSGISAADELLVISFALIISAIMLWRTVVVALSPSRVTLGAGDITLHTFFFEKKLAWPDVKAVREPFPILPEGFMLEGRRWSFLISNGMDAADELSDAIREKIGQPPDKKPEKKELPSLRKSLASLTGSSKKPEVSKEEKLEPDAGEVEAGVAGGGDIKEVSAAGEIASGADQQELSQGKPDEKA